MEKRVSKSEFKARALAWFREVEETGETLVITDRGRPVLRLERHVPREPDPRALLRGSVLEYRDPLEPVAEDGWKAAR